MTLTNLSKRFHLSDILFHKHIYTARFYKKDLFLKTSQYSQEKTSLSRSITTYIYYKTVCPFHIFHSHKTMSITVSKTIRSSRTEVFSKKVFVEISQNSQENTYTRDSFLIKLQASGLLKKRLWHRRFPVNFAKFLRTPFFS